MYKPVKLQVSQGILCLGTNLRHPLERFLIFSRIILRDLDSANVNERVRWLEPRIILEPKIVFVLTDEFN